MQIYHWNQETKEYIGSTRSPYIIPGATRIPPPHSGPDETAIWNEVDEAWKIQPDFRGRTMYRKTTQESKTIDQIGPIPDEWTLNDPQLVDADTRRSNWLTFDDAADSWRIDASKKSHTIFSQFLQELEAEHDRRVHAGCHFDGLVFAAHGEARRLLQEIIQANRWPHVWFDRDFMKEIVLQDSDHAKGLLTTMHEFVSPIKKIKYRKIAELSALRTKNDPDAIGSYDPAAGWPTAT